MRSPATEIIRTLDGLRRAHRPGEIFSDWVDVCYQGLRMLPRHAESLLSGGHLADDDEEARECFRRVDERYGREGYETFRKAYWQVLTAADEEPFYDPFGTVYEEWELGNERTGQFFTPQEICRMMAQVTAPDAADRVRTRLREALRSEPTVKIADVMGCEISDRHLETLVAESSRRGDVVPFEPVRVYDPACGSGRLLLAVAEQVPQWMVHRGLILFHGQDIDRDCVLMAKANCMLYGMNGHAPFFIDFVPRSQSWIPAGGEQLNLL